MSETMLKKEVVVTADDMNNLEGFFQNFKLDMPERLSKEIAIFREKGKEYTFQDQLGFRAAVAMAFHRADHELLNDPLFNKIREKCLKGFYSVDFKEAFEKILTEEPILTENTNK